MADDDSNTPTSEQETAEAVRQLLNRPSLEDTEERVRSVVEQIAAVGSELVPGMRWQWIDDRRGSDCGRPFDRTRGIEMNLPNYWTRDVPIPDSIWPQFLARVHLIAADVGATAVEVMQDRPAAHDIWFSSPDGITIKVTTKRATVISASTGCRLFSDRFDSPIRPTS
ncbi:LppA family lipoprotein [Nocardia sp. NPDC050710]|uniref:LppA family lipoprotein n=1 Tax=Nocardia sp. NPDC050710 TaxID=3157220 RepID=UPI00340EB0FE